MWTAERSSEAIAEHARVLVDQRAIENTARFARAVALIMTACPRVGDVNAHHLVRDVIRCSFNHPRILTRREHARRLFSVHPDIDLMNAKMLAWYLFPADSTI